MSSHLTKKLALLFTDKNQPTESKDVNQKRRVDNGPKVDYLKAYRDSIQRAKFNE